MKKIGLLGGMAWPSTIDYYRAICSGANAHFRDHGAERPLPTPWITIESVNMAETRALRGIEGDEASWTNYDAVLRATMQRLEAAGCEVLAMASNTPHARLHAFRNDLNVPVISIVDETSKVALATGAQHALVLGTSVTMRGAHYPRALAEHGLEVLPRLDAVDIDAMQYLIDTEFHSGASARGKAEMLALCQKVVSNPKDTTILLACTELPLAYPEHVDRPVFEADGLQFVNTAAAHVAAILDEALVV